MDVQAEDLVHQSGICVRRVASGGNAHVVVRSGHRLNALRRGEILVADDDGPRWAALSDLAAGDCVAIRYGSWRWPTTCPRLDGFMPEPAYGSQKPIRIPEVLYEKLALLLGMYVAEGSSVASNWTVSITNADAGVRERAAGLIRSLFDVEPFIQTVTDAAVPRGSPRSGSLSGWIS